MMKRLTLVGVLAVAWLATVAQAQNNLAPISRANADGVTPDHAGLPMKWTVAGNVPSGGRCAGLGVVVPDRVGRPCVPDGRGE